MYSILRAVVVNLLHVLAAVSVWHWIAPASLCWLSSDRLQVVNGTLVACILACLIIWFLEMHAATYGMK